MTNKKFYIFLFINFFLLKIHSSCLCRKKKPESNIYFEDGYYPTITLNFTEDIDVNDIYYDIYLYIEKEGKEHRDSIEFYYGIPNEELNKLVFSEEPNFLEDLNTFGVDKLQDMTYYIIDKEYVNKNIKDDKSLIRKYYSNYITYKCGYYFYYFFDEKNNENRMYKKLLPIKKEDYSKALTNTTFSIDKLGEIEKTKEIKVNGKFIETYSCDYRIRTEFYIKNKDQTITVEFYRSKVQNTKYFTFNCEIFFNGKKIVNQTNIINNNNDSTKNNIFTINNKL